MSKKFTNSNFHIKDDDLRKQDPDKPTYNKSKSELVRIGRLINHMKARRDVVQFKDRNDTELDRYNRKINQLLRVKNDIEIGLAEYPMMSVSEQQKEIFNGISNKTATEFRTEKRHETQNRLYKSKSAYLHFNISSLNRNLY